MNVDGVLLIDKPIGPTSHDVVARVRRALDTRAVGHAGTLDPMASGLLVALVNEATKLSPYLSADDKVYDATIRFGAETDTLDAQGNVTRTSDLPRDMSKEAIQAACSSMSGKVMQKAPAVSAIKVDGKALHARVRAGEDVDAPVREVLLREALVEDVTATDAHVRVDCGKGFYVRSFARDLGELLGSLAHLTALRRTQSGQYDVSHAVDFVLVQEAANGSAAAKATLREKLLSLEQATSTLPRVSLNAQGTEDVRHGRALSVSGAERLPNMNEGDACTLFGFDGALLAIGKKSGDVVRVARGFVRRS